MTINGMQHGTHPVDTTIQADRHAGPTRPRALSTALGTACATGRPCGSYDASAQRPRRRTRDDRRQHPCRVDVRARQAPIATYASTRRCRRVNGPPVAPTATMPHVVRRTPVSGSDTVNHLDRTRLLCSWSRHARGPASRACRRGSSADGDVGHAGIARHRETESRRAGAHGSASRCSDPRNVRPRTAHDRPAGPPRAARHRGLRPAARRGPGAGHEELEVRHRRPATARGRPRSVAADRDVTHRSVNMNTSKVASGKRRLLGPPVVFDRMRSVRPAASDVALALAEHRLGEVDADDVRGGCAPELDRHPAVPTATSRSAPGARRDLIDHERAATGRSAQRGAASARRS